MADKQKMQPGSRTGGGPEASGRGYSLAVIFESVVHGLKYMRSSATQADSGLSTDSRPGESRFCQFFCVWIGFVFVLIAVCGAKAVEWADGNSRVPMGIDAYVPLAKWVIIGAVLAITAIVSGFIAHGHTNKGKTYSGFILLGINWGFAAIFVVAIAPTMPWLFETLREYVST